MCEQVSEAVAGVLTLASCDRNGEFLPQVAVALQILRNDRFLKPAHVQPLQLASDAQGVTDVVGVVGISEQRHIGANRFADHLDASHVRLDGEQTELDLENPEAILNVRAGLVREGLQRLLADTKCVLAPVVAARCVGRHRLPERTSQQCVDGQPRCLTEQIPAGDVNGADRLKVWTLLSKIADHAVKLFPQHGRVARFGAKHL